MAVEPDRHLPLLTDQPSLIATSDRIIWVNSRSTLMPSGIKAQVTLAATASQLREAVEAVMKGESWGLNQDSPTQQRLSNREREIITLLVKGLGEFQE